MSYILDALNKSDQERRASQIPSLNTMHQPPVASQPSYRWLIILLVLAAINGGGYWYWINQPAPAPESQSESSIDHTSVKTMDEPQIVKAEAETEAVSPQPPTSGLQLAAGEILISPPSARPVPNQTQQAITDWVSIGALPVNVQRQIPSLKISSHLYSDDPELRMVNINGKMIREGESISPGFRLVLITEEGVVINFRHYSFEVSVLRDWSFN